MEQLGDALAQQSITKEMLEIVENKIKHWVENPPTTICVNVVLNDSAALKHIICKEIIMHLSNVTEQEADWYIVRSGAERELDKLTSIGIMKKADAPQ